MKYTAKTFMEGKLVPVNALPNPLILVLLTTVENASMALASILRLRVPQEMHLKSKIAWHHLETRDSSVYSRRKSAQGPQQDPH